MRHFRMDDPELQGAALSLRIQKELKGLLAEPPDVSWEIARGPSRSGLAQHFDLGYPELHRFRAPMRLVDGQKVELELYVDGEAELPAGLELFASIGWAPGDPVGYVLGSGGFEGPPRDADPLNDDDELRRLVHKILRDEWERGDISVEHDEPLVEVIPDPPIIHASTLPRRTWLGFVNDFCLLPFVQAAARIEGIQNR